MNKTAQISLLLLVAIVAVATYIYVGGKPNMQELKKSVAPAASLYPEAKSVSDMLNFINDESIDTHLSEASKGRWALLYFGYTSCPDVCPIVFISVDPMRDIGKLDQFASAFNPSFLGLTAHQKNLMAISRSLGVYHEVVESQKLAQEDHSDHDSDGGHSSDSEVKDNDNKTAHYDIDHTSSYLLFNPELKLTALLTSPHEPSAMAQAIDKIIENLR